MEVFIGIVVTVAVVFLLFNLFRSRKRRMEEAANQSQSAAATGLAVSRDLFEAELGHHAPVQSFHVVGDEARVTFDVPLSGDDDPILNDLLVGEAVEVVREKRKTLPIDEVHYIVVYAGRDEPREVARTKLATPGELPPPMLESGLSLAAVAHDPFAAPFDDEADHSVTVDMKVDVPEDELGPIRDELNLPKGLERGLRSIGEDPDLMGGPDFILALLKMFGYRVTEQAYDGTYLAVKDGVTTYIATDTYEATHHPELQDGSIQRFLAAFGSSGADRGMLITDKYGPFKVHEIETRQPKVKFVTRERMQRFVDSMSLG